VAGVLDDVHEVAQLWILALAEQEHLVDEFVGCGRPVGCLTVEHERHEPFDVHPHQIRAKPGHSRH